MGDHLKLNLAKIGPGLGPRTNIWRKVQSRIVHDGHIFDIEEEKELLNVLANTASWKDLIPTEWREIYGALYSESTHFDISEHENAKIEKDVHRTFSLFTRNARALRLNFKTDMEEYHLALYSVLVAASHERGYCQGINFLAAVFLLKEASDKEAYIILSYILKHRYINILFDPRCSSLLEYMNFFERMLRIHNRAVYNHFKSVGFGTICFLIEWFTTCFIVSCPGELSSCALDLVIVGYEDIMIRIGLAILDCLEKELLELTNEELQLSFKAKTSQLDPYKVMHRALTIPVYKRQNVLMTMAMNVDGMNPDKEMVNTFCRFASKQRPQVAAEVEAALCATSNDNDDETVNNDNATPTPGTGAGVDAATTKGGTTAHEKRQDGAVKEGNKSSGSSSKQLLSDEIHPTGQVSFNSWGKHDDDKDDDDDDDDEEEADKDSPYAADDEYNSDGLIAGFPSIAAAAFDASSLSLASTVEKEGRSIITEGNKALRSIFGAPLPIPVAAETSMNMNMNINSSITSRNSSLGPRMLRFRKGTLKAQKRQMGAVVTSKTHILEKLAAATDASVGADSRQQQQQQQQQSVLSSSSPIKRKSPSPADSDADPDFHRPGSRSKVNHSHFHSRSHCHRHNNNNTHHRSGLIQNTVAYLSLIPNKNQPCEWADETQEIGEIFVNKADINHNNSGTGKGDHGGIKREGKVVLNNKQYATSSTGNSTHGRKNRNKQSRSSRTNGPSTSSLPVGGVPSAAAAAAAPASSSNSDGRGGGTAAAASVNAGAGGDADADVIIASDASSPVSGWFQNMWKSFSISRGGTDANNKDSDATDRRTITTSTGSSSSTSTSSNGNMAYSGDSSVDDTGADRAKVATAVFADDSTYFGDTEACCAPSSTALTNNRGTIFCRNTGAGYEDAVDYTVFPVGGMRNKLSLTRNAVSELHTAGAAPIPIPHSPTRAVSKKSTQKDETNEEYQKDDVSSSAALATLQPQEQQHVPPRKVKRLQTHLTGSKSKLHDRRKRSVFRHAVNRIKGCCHDTTPITMTAAPFSTDDDGWC